MSDSDRLREEKAYIREVERHFLRRRGSPLLLSPKDWALALGWFEEGVPLSFVIAGIDAVFEKLEAEGAARRARTLGYCRSAVEELWDERRRHLTGAVRNVAARGVRGPAIRPAAEALDAAAGKIRAAAERLGGRAGGRLSELADEVAALAQRCCATEPGGSGSGEENDRLDRAVERIDRAVLDALEVASAGEAIERTKGEAAERLEPHRPHMSARAYRRTLARAVENRLRRHHGVPRLALLLSATPLD